LVTTIDIGVLVAIKTFKHKGLKAFFERGTTKGILAAHSKKIALILDRLEAAGDIKDMNYPGSNLHRLSGQLSGFYSVHVNGNWTIIFRFQAGDACDVNLVDYH
jgi:toxin HigB-1